MHCRRLVFALTLVVMTALLIGCGGNASPAPTTATPTPTPAPPAPGPTGGSGSGGSGSGGGTGGGGSNPATQYDVKMLPPDGAPPGGSGEVTINTSGDVNVAVAGIATGGYTIYFCMWPVKSYAFPCFQVGAISVAGSSAQTTFHFPKSGTWAGLFDVRDATSHQLLQTAGDYNTFNGPLMQFESASTTNEAGAIAKGPQSPGTGTVTASGGTAHYTITGGAPNTSYDAQVCFQTDTSCHSMGQFMTDGSGNATAALTIYTGPGGVAIFEAIPAGSAALVSGFKVP